jgi:hypothetical protein
MFTRTLFYTTARRHLNTFRVFSQSAFIAGFFSRIRDTYLLRHADFEFDTQGELFE